jgi:alginate O-acetyltransferase complex protein AlgF
MRCAPARAVLLALLIVSFPLAAANKSVYGPEVPGDSAFVRIVNAASGAAKLSAELGATTWEPLGFAEASPYRPVTPDIYSFSVDGREVEIIPGSGRYYTIAVLPKDIVVLEDPAHTDPARAQIFLYNFSSLPRVELATADGKTTVIAAVRQNASGLAVVNAVAAKLAVRSGGAQVKGIGDLGLARGSSFSVFVLGDAGSPFVFTLKAAVKAE